MWGIHQFRIVNAHMLAGIVAAGSDNASPLEPFGIHFAGFMVLAIAIIFTRCSSIAAANSAVVPVWRMAPMLTTRSMTAGSPRHFP